jgi:hypothetical protein
VVAELGGNLHPFVEQKLSDNRRLRTFPETIWEDDLVWHRDHNDRHIIIMSSDGWQLQMDNELPKDLVMGDSHFIPKETYHRLIKGVNDLVVEIIEP